MKKFLLVVGMVLLWGGGSPAWALIGEPVGAGPGGTFGITISQGGTVLLQRNDLVLPSDIKINDGDGEGYIVLDNANWLGSEIILKVVSDGGPSEDMRTLHFYIDSIAPGNIHEAGATSLFDPANTGLISVEINNLSFGGAPEVEPTVLDQDVYLVSFMRNELGHFYESADANPYVTNLWEVQVPGNKYLDSDAGHYAFSKTDGNVVSWSWQNLINPGTGTSVVDLAGVSYPAPSSGFVHELGLAVSFVGVPEPGTILLLLGGLPLMIFRRRQED